MQRHYLMTVLLPLFFVISLSGCGNKDIKFSSIGQTVETPEIPDPATATQRDVARLLARLDGALDSCNAQLGE